jgi:hypothetical protein
MRGMVRKAQCLIALGICWLCIGCGSRYDVVKDATVEGRRSPIAIVFDPPSSERKVNAQISTRGFYADSFFVVADSEKAALDMIDVEKGAARPGVSLLGKLEGVEVKGVELQLPAGKKFAVVTYLVDSATGGKGDLGKAKVSAAIVQK